MKPIIFSAEVVPAILAGAGTQTRRAVTPQPGQPLAPYLCAATGELWWCHPDGETHPDGEAGEIEYTDGTVRRLSVPKVRSWRCPYGAPGGLLWVRETLQNTPTGWLYRADRAPLRDAPERLGWERSRSRDFCASIHMPRWAARLFLRVTEVRVEQLQEISEADILAEGVTVPLAAEVAGVPWPDLPTLHHAWEAIWNAINGKRHPWESNPWVWVIDFERVEKPKP